MSARATSFCRCIRQAWTPPKDDAVAAAMLKDVRDMQKIFQIVLGLLFAATFAALVNRQGNFTTLDGTLYQNLVSWEKASSTGYGYLAFYSQDAACSAIKDSCWQAFQTRNTNATVWERNSECSSCSQWTDSHDLSLVKNYLQIPHTRQHKLFLEWLVATLALSAITLFIGAILHLLPLRPLFVGIICMRLVVFLTACAMLSAVHTVRQSFYIKYARDQEYMDGIKPAITAIFSFVWALAVVLVAFSLVWNPLMHAKAKDPDELRPSVVRNGQSH